MTYVPNSASVEMQQLRQRMQEDRLSSLPPELIDIIISHLPLRSAVRTGALSHQWRGRWRSAVRQFDFNLTQIAKGHYDAFAYIVDRVFASVTGASITLISFTGLTYVYSPRIQDDLSRWVSFAVGRGVTALRISSKRGARPLQLGAGVFSRRCTGLLSLSVCRCYLTPYFICYEQLTSLELSFSRFKKGCDLSRIIGNCPNLSDLKLYRVSVAAGMLKIVAPNLRRLWVYCLEVTRLRLKGCSELAVLSIFRVRDYSYVNYLFKDPCPKIRYLSLDFKPEPVFERRIPNTLFGHRLQNLRDLKLYSLNLGSRRDLLLALCLFNNSPVIDALTIYVRLERTMVEKWGNKFWKKSHPAGLHCLFERLRLCPSFRQLTSVVVFIDWPGYLAICEFFLANCPVLESFTLGTYGNLMISEVDWMRERLVSDAAKASEDVKITTIIKAVGVPLDFA